MLVIDTEKTLEFCETLQSMAPSHQVKVLRFVAEVLENTKLLEQRVERPQRKAETSVCFEEDNDGQS